MKTILSIMLCLFMFCSQAQDLPKSVKDTTINKVTYKLYVGARGGKYVLMTSKNTGKTYKRYIQVNPVKK